MHQVVKYGVIRKDSLCRDLSIWDTLYTAGRLQKPVLTLEADAEVDKASKQNRMSALIASLLLLPKLFSEKVSSLILHPCMHANLIYTSALAYMTSDLYRTRCLYSTYSF